MYAWYVSQVSVCMVCFTNVCMAWYVTQVSVCMVCFTGVCMHGMLHKCMYAWYVSEVSVCMVCYTSVCMHGVLHKCLYAWYVTQVSVCKHRYRIVIIGYDHTFDITPQSLQHSYMFSPVRLYNDRLLSGEGTFREVVLYFIYI